ncbi:hypothetical protein [Glaesserella parasuis]|nr:hypothetical protein [Glaesserella parasuis]EQA00790.1 hypothetical protein HPSNAG_1452 [Glaesserella parasuis str. Nagasaki]
MEREVPIGKSCSAAFIEKINMEMAKQATINNRNILNKELIV